MRIASTEALHPPLVFRSEFSPASLPAYRAPASDTRAAGDGEAPDPSYWTAYDYFMLEREARNVRRAFVFSLVAGWIRRLRRMGRGRRGVQVHAG